MSRKNDGIYDARQLGYPKMMVLGLQHMFAMFGATVLVPALTGLSVSATLLFAGLGTLLFHFLTKGKVPAFLGSSFVPFFGFVIRFLFLEGFNKSTDLVAIFPLGYIYIQKFYFLFSVRFGIRYFIDRPPVLEASEYVII